MGLTLDHFFILLKDVNPVAQRLLDLGLEESFARDHPGQGTSNRRFCVANSMLELLYVRDEHEANSGPAKNLNFPQRLADPSASPFGIVVRRKDDSSLAMPFSGWKYQPDYFAPPMAFHVGESSNSLKEPLCIYVPFIDPVKNEPHPKGAFKFISDVKMTVKLNKKSDVLRAVESAQGLRVECGDEHLLEVTFDKGCLGLSEDLRPHAPLIIHY